MFGIVLAAVIALTGEMPAQAGMIAGAVVAPPHQEISYPLQVVLLSPQYVDVWNTEVQKRLDIYWQQYQPAFRKQKELFSEFSKQAHKDATSFVVARMYRDGANASGYLSQTSRDGKFEFKNIPFGEYKILAFGKIGNDDVIWQEFVDIRSSIPHFVELKKRVP